MLEKSRLRKSGVVRIQPTCLPRPWKGPRSCAAWEYLDSSICQVELNQRPAWWMGRAPCRVLSPLGRGEFRGFHRRPEKARVVQDFVHYTTHTYQPGTGRPSLTSKDIDSSSIPVCCLCSPMHSQCCTPLVGLIAVALGCTLDPFLLVLLLCFFCKWTDQAKW